MEVKEQIVKFLNKRPDVIAAYGYGSGVFKQAGYKDTDKPQIDLILAVKDIRAWHLENIEKNPDDYSFIGRVFYSNASRKKIKGFNGITYQSNILEKNVVLKLKSKNGMEREIEENSQMFKYGVIEYDDLEKQLKTWNRFYLVGRLQKNILKIKSTKNMDELINLNRESALITALYFLEDEATLTELYEKIVSLSFIGDTRMRFFENPNKIKNIVSKAKEEFDLLYKKENPYFEINGEKIKINRKNVEKAFLPPSLAYALIDVEKDDLKAMREGIYQFLKEKNKEESIRQTLHGIETNGIVRSADYALQKMKKRIYKK